VSARTDDSLPPACSAQLMASRTHLAARTRETGRRCHERPLPWIDGPEPPSGADSCAEATTRRSPRAVTSPPPSPVAQAWPKTRHRSTADAAKPPLAGAGDSVSTPGGTRTPNLLIRRPPSGVRECPSLSTESGANGSGLHICPQPSTGVHREWLPTWLPRQVRTSDPLDGRGLRDMRFTDAVTQRPPWWAASCLEVEVTSQGESVEAH
jgi:hypothetical protein